jgi:arylsulfatase A-like enzyme
MKPIFIHLALSVSALLAAPASPNIIIIYADDLGYGDSSCYGATAVKTPNIDRLAQDGLRFTSGYCTDSTCTPSRYSMLTGEYAFRKKGTHVLPGDAALIIEPGRATLPSLLKKAGYRTGIVGKWHLGLGTATKPVDWNGEIKPGPLEVGFDESFILAATADRVPCVYIQNHRVLGLDPQDPIQVSYEKPFPGEWIGANMKDRSVLKMEGTRSNSPKFQIDGGRGHNAAVINGIGRIGYMTGGNAAIWNDEDMADVFNREAIAFIERSKAKPFFLYFATSDIHAPNTPNARFVGQTAMGRRGDAIVQFDDSVGQILKKLDELNLAENTLVILSSDNGPKVGDGYDDGSVEKLGDHKAAGPLRGEKYTNFEGGTRVPFIVRWPGHVKPGTSAAMVSQVDFCASLAELTGQKKDDATMRDSQNQLPALLGESTTGRDHVVQSGQALRSGKWKFIEQGKGRKNTSGQLFDLEGDLGESNNLAANNPEKVKELKTKLREITGK